MIDFRFSDEVLDELERIQSGRGGGRGKVDRSGNNRFAQAVGIGDDGHVRAKGERSQRAFHALERAGRCTPQVVVKITGRINGSSGVLGSFIYVSRLGMPDQELQPLETSEGKLLLRADDMMQLAREWHLHEMSDEARRKGATALSMVFSMPPGTDAGSVREAVQDFAEQDMANRRWVMVLHTDESHPHVHLIVAARNDDGRRFNPNREFLSNCRERFAENLRARGIDADATRRAARGYPPRQEKVAVRKMRERGIQVAPKSLIATKPHHAENVERVKAVYLRAAEELESYGGASQLSCAAALRGLVKSMSIVPDVGEVPAHHLSERSQAALSRLAKTAEGLRLLTAELNAKSADRQACRVDSKLSKQAEKLEQMVLGREREIARERERGKDRDRDDLVR